MRRTASSRPGRSLDGAFPRPPASATPRRRIEFLADAGVRVTWTSSRPGCGISGRRDARRQRPRTAWAAFLAGPVPEERYEGPEAEIERYDADGRNRVPAAPSRSADINRTQNARLLHSFLVVAEHLRVPPGGRVLDLGGGSAWVSELLAQARLPPDYARRVARAPDASGRRRFAREGLTPRFTVGDMTRLPVATGSMDAVVVMDALHHVPDVPAVFREAFRVLADGRTVRAGRARRRALRNREVARRDARARRAGARDSSLRGRSTTAAPRGSSDIGVVPHYVPRSSMTPEDVQAGDDVSCGSSG